MKDLAARWVSAGRPLGAGPAGHQGLMLIHLKGM
jgi:hypothetical protein